MNLLASTNHIRYCRFLHLDNIDIHRMAYCLYRRNIVLDWLEHHNNHHHGVRRIYLVGHLVRIQKEKKEESYNLKIKSQPAKLCRKSSDGVLLCIYHCDLNQKRAGRQLWEHCKKVTFLHVVCLLFKSVSKVGTILYIIIIRSRISVNTIGRPRPSVGLGFIIIISSFLRFSKPVKT